MRTSKLIAVGALAATGLAAGMASATPVINGSVTANRVGHGRVQVTVPIVRGDATTPPMVDVTVNGRTRHAHARDWTTAQAGNTVVWRANFRGGRRAYTGSTITVHVKACDAVLPCVDQDFTNVTVTRIRPAVTNPGSSKGKGDDKTPAPLPAGSVDAGQAAAIATTTVGPGSLVLRVEREDHGTAVWEVTVLRPDGVRVEVKIAADGTVVSTEVKAPDAPKVGGHDDAPGHH